MRKVIYKKNHPGTKNVKYKEWSSHEFTNCTFEAGLVENSPHPMNTVYFSISTNKGRQVLLEFTNYEATMVAQFLKDAVHESLFHKGR